MNYSDADGGELAAFVSRRVWNYGKAGYDRTHMLKLNFVWDLPSVSAKWNNAFSRIVLDQWQISGITTFSSGAPLGIAATYTESLDITGSPTEGARTVLIANPVMPKNERTFDRNFNTQAFAPPAIGTAGNAAKDLIRGPGINNWDIALFKNIPLREALRLQFRWELYNAFNHTQFSALDTTARFNYGTKQQLNARFGAYTAAEEARKMQLSLRLQF